MLSRPEERTSPEPQGARPSRPTAWIVRWRLALRLARRDARRAKGRTVLVMLMVGLPVLAIVAGDVLYRTTEVSAVEALPSRLGAADARIEGLTRSHVYADPVEGTAFEYSGSADPPWTADEIAARLPAGSEVVSQQVGRVAFRTAIGYATVDAYADDLTRPIRTGAFPVVEGRVPTKDGEVAISAAVAQRGIEVGDRLQLTRDDVPATVVGVVRTYTDGDVRFVVVPPSS